MQSSVFALVKINVYGNFLDQVQWLAVGGLETLQVCRDYVIQFARRHPLGELAHMVGKHLPLGLFVFSAADLHFDAVHRTIVRTPDGTDNEGVWLFVLGLSLSGKQKAWA